MNNFEDCQEDKSYNCFSEGEIEATDEAKVQPPQEQVERSPQEQYQSKSENDYFSDEIFKQLPEFFNKVVQPFTEGDRARDVVFTASLVSTSACIPKWTCNYQGDTIHANLYAVVLAPPANDKGIAKWGIELVNDIDSFVKGGLRDSNGQISVGKIQNGESGKLYGFRIPPDTSGAALMAAMKDNEDLGCIMYAPEADIIKSVTAQKWGNSISETLRSIFHHERVASNRISGGVIEIKNPKLSALFTGTPSELNGMVKGKEDGLLSRYLFYKFDPTPQWKKMSSRFGGMPNKDVYSGLAEELLQIFKWYLMQGQIEFFLTKEQTESFDNRFEAAFADAYEIYGSSGLSVITRLGIITYRIAMIISAFRNYNRPINDGKIMCEDVDFKTTLSIIDTFQYHALSVLETINGSKYDLEPDLKETFYANLPSTEFKKSTADTIGERLNIPVRTIGRTLNKWLGKRLKQPRYGYYVKI